MTNKSTTAERKVLMEQVLEALRARKSVGVAAREAGVTRSCLYDWKSKDEAFSDAWDDLMEATTDQLELTALEYALEGYSETKTIDDGTTIKVETTHKRDPNTLRFMLASRRRGVYGHHSSVELSGELTTKRIVFGAGPDAADPDPEPLDEA